MKELRRENIIHPVEESEPQAGSAAVPIWIVVFFGLLFYASTMYLDRHAGGFNQKVYEPYASLKALEADHPKDDADKALAQGRQVYVTYCAPCHQPSGLGSAGIAPPLVGSEWVIGPGPNRIIRIILHGLSGPIKVKGVDFNLSMVPWKDSLKDEDIAAVTTFIRQNKEWGHAASAVKPEEVKTIRDKESARSSAWTAAELETIPES